MSNREQVVLNDRYELQRRVGRGGMAEVFLARDRLLDRPVAIKILFPEFATDPSFVARPTFAADGTLPMRGSCGQLFVYVYVLPGRAAAAAQAVQKIKADNSRCWAGSVNAPTGMA